MKHLKATLFLLVAILWFGEAQAQQDQDPPKKKKPTRNWTLGIGHTGMDYAPLNTAYEYTNRAGTAITHKPEHKFKNWGHGAYLNLTKKIVPHLEGSFSTSLAQLSNYDQLFPDRVKSVGAFMADLGLRYVFLPEAKIIDPYLLANAGNLWIDKESKLFANGGLGINFWLDEGVAINIQSAYEMPFDKEKNGEPYLHHRIGFRFALEKPLDTDEDGVPDSKDKCPEVAGKPELGGCPDGDDDGIIDSEDDCPNAAGTAEFKGCPDTDGDGIIDKDDKCPNKKGEEKYNGCPDTDGDGIGDNEDRCPNEKGPKLLYGCPDKDGDGISDKEDKCPDVKGDALFKGCPDTDGDGVQDSEDKCPKVKGTTANNGCPEVKVAPVKLDQKTRDRILVAARAIHFKSGSDIITNDSFSKLDEILSILIKYPSLRFNIDGYTDSVGNADKNKTLSQKRADAVKKYFTVKGISSARLTSTGYGIIDPIADNKTAAGRAKNRRVEIKQPK